MATARATGKALTRRRFLDAAARLFAERGFHAVSIGELGAEVGVSGPALYRHFPSKEAMLEEILLGTSEYLLQGGQDIADAEHSSDDALLRALVDFHLEFALTHRDVIRVQDRELATLSDESNRRVRRLQRQYLNLWAEAAGRIRTSESPEDLQILMHGLFGLLNSTAHNAQTAGLEQVRTTLTASALRVLLG